MEKIIEGLKKLDVNNDNHWTSDGLPRIDTVKLLAGDQSLTREQISGAAQGFNRASAATFFAMAQGSTTEQPIPPVNVPQGLAHLPQSEDKPEQESSEQDESEAEQGTFELEQLQKIHAELTTKKNEVEKELRSVTAAIDKILDAQVKESSKSSPVQAYLANQRKLLEQRAEKIEALKGVDLRELTRGIKSPLDASLKQRRR